MASNLTTNIGCTITDIGVNITQSKVVNELSTESVLLNFAQESYILEPATWTKVLKGDIDTIKSLYIAVTFDTAATVKNIGVAFDTTTPTDPQFTIQSALAGSLDVEGKDLYLKNMDTVKTASVLVVFGGVNEE